MLVERRMSNESPRNVGRTSNRSLTDISWTSNKSLTNVNCMSNRSPTDINYDIKWMSTLTSTMTSGNTMADNVTNVSLQQQVMQRPTTWKTHHCDDQWHNTTTMAEAALQQWRIRCCNNGKPNATAMTDAMLQFTQEIKAILFFFFFLLDFGSFKSFQGSFCVVCTQKRER